MKERKKYREDRFVYLRRKKDGQMIDVSEKVWHEDMISIQDEFEFIGYMDDVNQEAHPPAKFSTPGDESMFACPLCGKAYKTADGLKKHKEKDHA